MSDLAATLRRLADACDACDHLASSFSGSATECFLDQRQTLADALPGIGWDGAAADLRAMADEVERLRRVLAVERGDESAAPRGWRCEGRWWSGRRHHVESDKIGGKGRFWFYREPGAARRGEVSPTYDTALEAMEAADRAAQEVSDV